MHTRILLIIQRSSDSSLNKGSFVTLKIFDVQGREVTTLVNEKRQTGYYEEIFDAANLSSGTYFYRLQTNTTIEHKEIDTNEIF